MARHLYIEMTSEAQTVIRKFSWIIAWLLIVHLINSVYTIQSNVCFQTLAPLWKRRVDKVSPCVYHDGNNRQLWFPIKLHHAHITILFTSNAWQPEWRIRHPHDSWIKNGPIISQHEDQHPFVTGLWSSDDKNIVDNLLSWLLHTCRWVGLTMAYDVTIPRYRKSQRKIKVSKMHILRCMGSKFCVKFQRASLQFHKNFEPIHHKICI